MNIYNMQLGCVPVAQLDRVLASDAKGCEFEPRRVCQIIKHKKRLQQKDLAEEICISK